MRFRTWPWRRSWDWETASPDLPVIHPYDGIWEVSETTLVTPASGCRIEVKGGVFSFFWESSDSRVPLKTRATLQLTGEKDGCLELTGSQWKLAPKLLPDGRLDFENPDGSHSIFERRALPSV